MFDMLMVYDNKISSLPLRGVSGSTNATKDLIKMYKKCVCTEMLFSIMEFCHKTKIPSMNSLGYYLCTRNNGWSFGDNSPASKEEVGGGCLYREICNKVLFYDSLKYSSRKKVLVDSFSELSWCREKRVD